MTAIKDPRALLDSALAAHRSGDLAAAADGYSRVLERVPDQPDALHLLGLVRLSQGALAEAEDLIRRALVQRAGIAEIWNSLGNVLAARGKTQESVAALREALAINPRLVGAMVNLGRHMNAEGDATEAEALWRRALAENPNTGEAWTNLGTLLYRDGRWTECVDAFEHAAALIPYSAFVANNLGMAYRAAGRVDDALKCQERACALDPTFQEARLAAAVIHLSLGHWREGWAGYLARAAPLHVENLTRAPLPSSLAGRRFLVRRNQGLGDELFFLRFLPELRRRGAERIVYECDPRLAAMLTRAGIADDVRPEPAAIEPDAIAVSVGDLPYLLSVGAGDPPPSIRLTAEAARRVTIGDRLRAAGPEPYLGVTWRAGSEGWMGISRKEVPLGELAAAIRAWPGTVVALQRQPAAGEVAAVARMSERPVADFTADNDSLEDMLAIVSELGAYVAVSNTNVHLRAATGRSTGVLVASPPDWRWMAAGDRSPWFPDCPLFRQANDGAWSGALRSLEATLGSFVKEG